MTSLQLKSILDEQEKRARERATRPKKKKDWLECDFADAEVRALSLLAENEKFKEVMFEFIDKMKKEQEALKKKPKKPKAVIVPDDEEI